MLQASSTSSPLIRVRHLFSANGILEVEVQVIGSGLHSSIGDLGFEVQLNAFGRLDLNDQSVAKFVLFLGATEQLVRDVLELDHDLSRSA